MEILSVNLGTPTKLPGIRQASGIRKMPVSHPVRVHTLGLEGDAVCNTKHHGGPDQAVYLYGEPDYAWWHDTLGQPMKPGTFGENLTMSALRSAEFNIGDRFHIGEVVLEVTSPRIPCGTLAKRMRDETFAEQFRQAERPGLYCRVICEGAVQAGDAVTVERFAGPTLSAVEMFRSFYLNDEDEASLQRQLAAPIAIRARAHKSRQLQKLRIR